MDNVEKDLKEGDVSELSELRNIKTSRGQKLPISKCMITQSDAICI